MAKLSKEEADQLAALQAKHEAPDEVTEAWFEPPDGTGRVRVTGRHAESLLKKYGLWDEPEPAAADGDDQGDGDDGKAKKEPNPDPSHRYFR
jgi:hypothetical protein